MAGDWPTLAAALQTAARDSSLAEAVRYTPVAPHPIPGAPVWLRGIFSAEYRRAVLEGDVAVEASGPMVSMHLADLPDGYAVRGDNLTIRGVAYVVREIQPDGEGNVDLILTTVVVEPP